MAVGADKVKALREQTGVGIMECKSALEETDGDIERAVELLRKRGIASAQKRAGRETKEGVVEAYIHAGSRLGVLVEVNCETDFVAKTDDFKRFVRDIAMQIAATNPRVVSREEFSKEEIDKETEIYTTQAKNDGKPENIIERFVQGKLEKFYQESVLLEQAFIKDPNKTIKDLLNEMIAKTGENINIRRFVRYQLGS
ncbi:MAG: translation elongation factor Ts [Calditrichaeota bacterium]|nr:MAG: translation elongation factor Ts [Calditrichota bacterium]